MNRVCEGAATFLLSVKKCLGTAGHGTVLRISSQDVLANRLQSRELCCGLARYVDVKYLDGSIVPKDLVLGSSKNSSDPRDDCPQISEDMFALRFFFATMCFVDGHAWRGGYQSNQQSCSSQEAGKHT